MFTHVYVYTYMCMQIKETSHMVENHEFWRKKYNYVWVLDLPQQIFLSLLTTHSHIPFLWSGPLILSHRKKKMK